MITLRDKHKLIDMVNDNNSQVIRQLKGGVRKTKIIIKDHETGEVIDTVENKVLVPGSQITACKQFGIDQVVLLPTYNSELNLQNSYDDWSQPPANEPITCLWCVGQSGFLSSPGEVLAVDTKERIEPINDILPFRYVAPEDDLDPDQREMYFGRKIDPITGMIYYYFKKFDTTPQLHVRYLDGTDVGPNMFNVNTPQDIEVYVEMRLSISRLDFRDYFDQVIGWDNAYVNTVSLCTAWYRDDIVENPGSSTDEAINYQWYQDIIPFSKFNFKDNDLTELNKAIDFIYQIYY